MVKHSVVPAEMHQAVLRARPFDCEEDATAAVLAHDIRPDTVFIRYEDPGRHAGMFYTTEPSPPTRRGKSIALITDGRFSARPRDRPGCSPEAAEGGPPSPWWKRGPRIQIDIPARVLPIAGVKGERKIPGGYWILARRRRLGARRPTIVGVLKITRNTRSAP